jgi:hypothetical protein
MAVAWAVSMGYIKLPEATMAYWKRIHWMISPNG